MAVWPHGPVTIASTQEGETMAEVAAAILATAPPRVALVCLSIGGIGLCYVKWLFSETR